ncbi:MAG: WbqC family protein, partial [Cyclobacteriaceae bacterium]
MKLAIMQPYLFPYIGYFQLIHAVDKFVFYDDVDFIKQGWISRNNILLNNQFFTFTVPLVSISSNQKINRTEIHLHQYQNWRKKFFKTLNQAYKKAPFYKVVMPIIDEVFGAEHKYINDLARESIIRV